MVTKSTTKTHTTKTAKTTKTAEKKTKSPVSKKAELVETAKIKSSTTQEQPVVELKAEITHLAKGKYVFATGRRKTAIANVRLFEGKGDMVVNKMPAEKYFNYNFFQDEITKPFEVTGLLNKYHFTSHINGGGLHSQAGALRHGISIALGKISEDVRKVLKKNGFLTRDDRKKERKKPGLKRARRSPQWAKR